MAIAPEQARAEPGSSAPASTTPALELDFEWQAPEACPTREQVLAELSRAVDAGGKELPPLVVRAQVTQEGATWRLELTTEMDGQRGTRQLAADSCEGLSRAATLVLALTLGEGIARRQAEAQARAEAKAVPATPAPPRRAPPARPAPPPKPRAADAWAALTVAQDVLRRWAPGVAVGARYRPGLLQLGLRLELGATTHTPLPQNSGELHAASGTAGALLCLAPSTRKLVVAACANASLTLLRASGVGTLRDRSATIPLYAVGPSLEADVLVGERAFVGAGVVARFYTSRPDLVVEGLDERLRTSATSVLFQLGAGVRW